MSSSQDFMHAHLGSDLCPKPIIFWVELFSDFANLEKKLHCQYCDTGRWGRCHRAKAEYLKYSSIEPFSGKSLNFFYLLIGIRTLRTCSCPKRLHSVRSFLGNPNSIITTNSSISIEFVAVKPQIQYQITTRTIIYRST